jgi:hypothetical protein
VTRHRSRFDRQDRLLRRCRLLLRSLNVRSDARLVADPHAARSAEAEGHYRRAARLVGDIDKELAMTAGKLS